ncbi:MAG TPA: CocE/NonD family hydrolase [Bryobacteraceae bacterium]|jgi:putative CocE/NonD family hydrolase|nr:CocE/NonD family hydrolase [Bryobacteraceae bacterium]
MKRAALAASLLLAGCTKQPTEWIKTDVMIPARDGVKLHTLIFSPKNTSGKLPFLMERSPYGFVNGGAERVLANRYKQLADEGFIFVLQDIRGRYGSEGEFVMQRHPRDRSKPNSIDEASDAYDTIEWLLKNVPNNNGRAGILGISYGGWLTAMALMEPHPALKAVSEQASPADMFLGDDFHHNGAFRLSYGFEYVARMETGKVQSRFDFDKFDTFDWYLSLGPLGDIDKRYFHGEKPTWNNFVNHPNFDPFWQEQAVQLILSKTTVPNLNVAGWWDQEDYWGPLKIYETLEKNDADHKNYLVIGPWRHGGWGGEGKALGPIDFAGDQSRYFREKIEAPWFAYWLKDKGSLKQPEAMTFETGHNSWQKYDAWPPKDGIEKRKLYTSSAGGLSFDAPRDASDSAFDSYTSDPAHPVPYRHRPIPPTYSPNSGWTTWLVEDQRFVDLRPDVLSWSTEALKDDVVIAGDVVAHLFASTSGSDSDWIVKLIDVYPENDEKLPGYQLMIDNEVFRARFRNSFEKPERVEPGKIYEYPVDLHSANHDFRRGHRIMVQVQSTWFPLIDRNPQTFVENIYKATAADYQPALQKIFRSAKYASYVELPVQRR